MLSKARPKDAVSSGLGHGVRSAAAREAIEREVDDGRGEQREKLREDEPAHDRDAERAPELGADTAAQRERQATEERRHRRHQDRAEPEETSAIDRLGRSEALLSLRFDRK